MDSRLGREVALANPEGTRVTLQRTGEVLIPMTKGVTIAGTLDESSAVEYKYSVDQPRDDRGRFGEGVAAPAEWFEVGVAERHLANGWHVSNARNSGRRGGGIPVFNLRHQSQPDNTLVFETLREAKEFALTHPGGTEHG